MLFQGWHIQDLSIWIIWLSQAALQRRPMLLIRNNAHVQMPDHLSSCMANNAAFQTNLNGFGGFGARPLFGFEYQISCKPWAFWTSTLSGFWTLVSGKQDWSSHTINFGLHPRCSFLVSNSNTSSIWSFTKYGIMNLQTYRQFGVSRNMGSWTLNVVG